MLLALFLSGILSYGTAQSDADLKLFANKELTKLHKKTKKQDIDQISSPALKDVAQQLANKSYQLQDRFKSYDSYLDPSILATQQKTNAYSRYENPTGIYFSEGDEAIIWVGQKVNKDIKLIVTNWDDEHFKQSEYTLEEGINKFTITNKGNSYIQYFTPDGRSTPKVDIHILSGKVNGVFNLAKDNNAVYKKLLDNNQGNILDIVGKKVHLAYSKASLKKFNPDHGVELIQLYDSIIHIQHELMGLVKYHREPKNHMFGRVIWKGFMHADGIGAAFHDNTMKDLVDPNSLRKNSWGVAHEFGHVNQVRPNMKWVGTTEVTNNIYSVWTQYLYNSESPKLEREKLKDYDGPIAGGRISAYMESAFIHKQPWLTQAGPDRWDRERPRDWGGDHFVKLVPLWQLQLYLAEAGKGHAWGNKNFYADVFIKAIDNPTTDAEQDSYYQLEFVKNACDVSKLDLTDFFEHSGILAPIDLIVDDYTVGRMKITEEDISQVKKYAAKYPKPSTPVLHYLTANSVKSYEKQLPVTGITGQGFEKQLNTLIVQHDQWKNAVAFETYAGNKLIKIAFNGLGSENAKTTIVQIPEGTTSVKAVGWDGTRLDVINL